MYIEQSAVANLRIVTFKSYNRTLSAKLFVSSVRFPQKIPINSLHILLSLVLLRHPLFSVRHELNVCKYVYFNLQGVNCLSVARKLIIQNMSTERVHPSFRIALHEHTDRCECSQPYQALTYVKIGNVTAAFQ